MRLIQYLFGDKKPSASLAKERLQVIIARERLNESTPLKLKEMQQEIVAVIARHLGIEPDVVKMNLDKQENFEVLEVKIEIPQEKLV